MTPHHHHHYHHHMDTKDNKDNNHHHMVEDYFVRRMVVDVAERLASISIGIPISASNVKTLAKAGAPKASSPITNRHVHQQLSAPI